MRRPWSIFIGYDSRESDAFAVARESVRRHLNAPIPIYGLVLDDLKKAGLYWRPTSIKKTSEKPLVWDDISDAPVSTEFSNSRFLVPFLAKEGLALFVDADVMARGSVSELFEMADPYTTIGVWCVQHNHNPTSAVKMDGQVQTQYGRKNWSSVCLWNCDHPNVRKLTPEMVNSLPGRDLHRFCFLEDSDIAPLDPQWNHLVGEVPPNPEAKLVHFTLGVPSMNGYADCEFADEWRAERDSWARGRFSEGLKKSVA